MKILVIGGTRYFGIHMVNKLLEQGHEVTIATRGKTPDSYGDKVERITIQRTNEESMREALQGKHFDVVIDKIVSIPAPIEPPVRSLRATIPAA